MKMTQTWGWLVAGVMAAGLNASYHNGGLQWIHQAAEQAEHNTRAVLALASGQADQFLTEARLVTASENENENENAQTPSCPLVTVLARVQTRVARTQTGFARVEVMSAREEAALARMEARRARIEARMARFQMPAVVVNPVSFRTLVDCPRVRVNIPQPPMIRMPAVPAIHVSVAGAGPV